MPLNPGDQSTQPLQHVEHTEASMRSREGEGDEPSRCQATNSNRTGTVGPRDTSYARSSAKSKTSA